MGINSSLGMTNSGNAIFKFQWVSVVSGTGYNVNKLDIIAIYLIR